MAFHRFRNRVAKTHRAILHLEQTNVTVYIIYIVTVTGSTPITHYTLTIFIAADGFGHYPAGTDGRLTGPISSNFPSAIYRGWQSKRRTSDPRRPISSVSVENTRPTPTRPICSRVDDDDRLPQLGERYTPGLDRLAVHGERLVGSPVIVKSRSR